MSCIDLQLNPLDGGGSTALSVLSVFLACPAVQESFQVTLPAELAGLQQAWLRRFLHHHSPTAAPLPADVVREYGLRLLAAMGRWLEQPDWLPLQAVLSRHPGLPLRLRCGSDWLERLPWELLPLDRPLWRLATAPTAVAAATSAGLRRRRPRLLLVLGDESSLDLNQEIQLLEDLARRGGIELETLRGPQCCHDSLRQALEDANGWELLVFLGHSTAASEVGGRLQLGDGSWLAAAALSQELQQAAGHGLQLVLFNSCSGIDLARSAIAAGVPWALCFREPVPTQAAVLAFSSLLTALEGGEELIAAAAASRRLLLRQGPVGSELLLSVYGGSASSPLRLPLSPIRQLQQRLATSQRHQALAAAIALTAAAALELVPFHPLGQYLLDRRLDLQRHWRLLTDQPGPAVAPVPVLLLDPRSTPGAILPAPAGQPASASRVSRPFLAALLRMAPVQQLPRLGLDVVLDEPAAGTAELAAVIRRQRRPLLLAGYYGPSSAAPGAGLDSLPIAQLRQAGLQAASLEVGIAAPGDGKGRKPLPLQLWSPITPSHFAGALAEAGGVQLPAEAVIDWSLPWPQLIHRVSLAQLPELREPLLLVGRSGGSEQDSPDLFWAPAALRPALPTWGGSEEVLPGVLLQAALIQSLNLRHWLTPLSLTACTAAAAGLGVLLAALLPSRRQRLVGIAVLIAVATPLALQLAVRQRLLLPLLLPLAALSATAQCRRD